MYKSCVVCWKLKAPLLLDSRGVCDTCIAVAKRAGIDPIDAVKAAAEAQKPPATLQEVVQEVKTQQAVVEAALPTPEDFAAEVAALRIGRHKEMLVEQQALEQAEIERKEAQQKEIEVRKAAQAEKARRDLARRRLLAYTKYFEEGYEAGWLHADICRRLEQFYEAVKRGESPRMILTVPPRHGKSTLASVNFPSWVLGDDPNLEFIACSYNSSLAMDFSRKVRDRINDPKYAKLFPNTRLSDSSQSAERWNTSGKGGYVAAGVRGPITGRGAHIGVIDDPVKDREDAESEVIRQQIKNWYSSTFYTRLAPGGGVLIILTRWHDDDLAGWLIQTMVEAEKEAAESGHWPEDADKWEVVSYKAIASEDEAYRKAGEALHPARYPVKALAKIKRTLLPRDWEALYQQNPVAEEGAYFTKDMFRYYTVQPPLSSLRIYAAWDFAIGKKEANDWTVGVVVGVDKDGRIYVLHRYRGRWATNEIVEKIIECQRVWSPLLQGFEEGQIASSFEPFLLKRLNEPALRSLGGIPYEKLKTRGRDKEARARAIQGRMQQGMVYFPEKVDWLVEFMNEFLRFPLGLHDDQVDALSWIGQMLLQLAAFTEQREKPKPGWRDRLKKRLAKQRTSVGGSAMSA